MASGDDEQRRAAAVKRVEGQVPVSDSDPGYPPLREHLLTRRDALTFMGAGLVTGLTAKCYIGGDDGGGPYFGTFRMPNSGDVTVPLSGGGALRCYFNAVAYADTFRSDLALSLLEVELGTNTYMDLANVYFGGDTQALRSLESELESSLDDPDFHYELAVQRDSLVLTMVELIQ